MFSNHRVYGTDWVEKELLCIKNGTYTLRRGGQFVPTPSSFLQKFHNFQPDVDDVWVCAYPKSGTTWLTEVVYWLRGNGHEEQVAELKKIHRDLGLTRVDLNMFTESDVQRRLDNLGKVPHPRVLVTHLAEGDMPQRVFTTGKVLVPLRNPKDTCVSYYHFHTANTTLGKYRGTLNDFIPEFLRGDVIGGDFYDFNQTYWNKHKNNGNVLFVHYEDMVEDPLTWIARIAKFVGVAINDDFLNLIGEKTRFDMMKKHLSQFITDVDHSVSPFFRKGISGDWKDSLTVHQNSMFNKLHKEIMTRTPDLAFKGMD